MAYKDLSSERKKAIGQAASDWKKENRVTLVSNVRPETREKFETIHERLKEEGKVNSKEDTIVYLCNIYFNNL